MGATGNVGMKQNDSKNKIKNSMKNSKTKNAFVGGNMTGMDMFGNMGGTMNMNP